MVESVRRTHEAAHAADAEMRTLVERFTRAWASPRVEGFVEILHPEVRLLQPVTRPVVGREAARVEFSRLLRFLPDMRGTVDHAAIDGEVALVAWRLAFTLGGRPCELRIADRLVVEAGLIREREAYYDSLGFLIELLRRPRAWPAYWRYRGYLPG